MICQNMCPVSCAESLYLYKVVNVNSKQVNYYQHFEFELRDSFYILIKYLPRYTFIELIISIANILSLWHGISFIGLLQDMMGYIRRYVDNCYIIQILYYMRCSNVNSLPLKILLKVSNHSNVHYVTESHQVIIFNVIFCIVFKLFNNFYNICAVFNCLRIIFLLQRY